jgi:hypothetical protein
MVVPFKENSKGAVLTRGRSLFGQGEVRYNGEVIRLKTESIVRPRLGYIRGSENII